METHRLWCVKFLFFPFIFPSFKAPGFKSVLNVSIGLTEVDREVDRVEGSSLSLGEEQQASRERKCKSKVEE